MRVLITGAYGYLGLAFARRLAAEHTILAVGRAPRPACAEAIQAAMPANVEQVQCDVRGLTAAGLRHIDAVVHLVGGGGSGGRIVNAAAALKDNVEAAHHVASIVPRGARRILASSIYVYGPTQRPAKETDVCAPDTLYGQLKRVAEAVWLQFGGSALRLAHVYGAGSGVDFRRDGVTERLARAAASGEIFTIHGTGDQRIDLVHIDDACEAVAAALARPALPPAVNIGGGETVSVAGLARVFKVREERASGDGLGVLRALDVSLADAVLGWAPRVTLQDGAQGLVEMIRNRGQKP